MIPKGRGKKGLFGLISSIAEASKTDIAEQISEEISSSAVEYNSDTDIIKYHNYILAILDQEIKRNDERKEHLKEIDRILETPAVPLRGVEKKKHLRDRKEITKEISEAVARKQKYLRDVKPILEEYEKAIRTQKEVFGSDKNILLFRNIVRAFSQTAKGYCKINFVEKLPESLMGKCPYCFSPLEEIEDAVHCQDCLYIFEDMLQGLSLNDSGMAPLSSSSSRNNYESVDNFIDALDAYQGLHGKILPDKLFLEVEAYVKANGIQKESLKPFDTREIFKITKNPSFYEDVHIFLHKYIERPLPDVSAIRDTVINEYKIFNAEYVKIKTEGKSAINSQFMLWVFLTRNGHKCDYYDFKIPDTEPIALQNRNNLIRVFTNLKWDYLPYI
jgi:hypothetical protein